MLLFRWKRDENDEVVCSSDGRPILQFVCVMRNDNHQWAIPGVSILMYGTPLTPILHLHEEGHIKMIPFTCFIPQETISIILEKSDNYCYLQKGMLFKSVDISHWHLYVDLNMCLVILHWKSVLLIKSLWYFHKTSSSIL